MWSINAAWDSDQFIAHCRGRLIGPLCNGSTRLGRLRSVCSDPFVGRVRARRATVGTAGLEGCLGCQVSMVRHAGAVRQQGQSAAAPRSVPATRESAAWSEVTVVRTRNRGSGASWFHLHCGRTATLLLNEVRILADFGCGHGPWSLPLPKAVTMERPPWLPQPIAEAVRLISDRVHRVEEGKATLSPDLALHTFDRKPSDERAALCSSRTRDLAYFWRRGASLLLQVDEKRCRWGRAVASLSRALPRGSPTACQRCTSILELSITRSISVRSRRGLL